MMRVRLVRYGVAATWLVACVGVLASCVSGVEDGTFTSERSFGGQPNGPVGNSGGSTSQTGSSGHGGGVTVPGAGSAGMPAGASGMPGNANAQGGVPNIGGTASIGGRNSTAGGSNAGGTTANGTGGTIGRGGSTGAAGSTGKAGSTGAAGTTGSTGTGTPLSPISGGSTGFATRYWDCCKPACAWPANQSMMSCDSGNNSQGKGNNSKSACDGGDSYMCYSYEPWVDSSNGNVAYGFAAASGGNYVCGRCFEVQFNGSGHSGGNNGLTQKTMYLQVINNGGVADNQFDILIPGGGVGALNACDDQWGQNADLGSQYGGLFAECKNDVSCTQNKCNSVFAGKPDLLAGCSWFLTWFTAADNPNIVFKQVSCPSQLSSKSGMSG